MKRSTLSVLVSAVLLVALPVTAMAATEIQFWHAMTAVLGERVSDIATKFNASQSEYVVKAINKGTYAEALNAAVAAYRAKQPPHIVQVYEVGTQTMLSSGAVYPVYQLMKDNGITIDWNDLIGPVKSYYSTGGNRAAARNSGIDTARIKFRCFVAMGGLCGLAAALLFGRIGLAPLSAGLNLELQVIAAIIVGGVGLFGGSGTVFGSFIGVLIISMITSGLILMGVSQYWDGVATGAVILVAVGLNLVVGSGSLRRLAEA